MTAAVRAGGGIHSTAELAVMMGVPCDPLLVLRNEGKILLTRKRLFEPLNSAHSSYERHSSSI